MTLRIGSLCTGYGGLDLAAEAVLGGRMVWYSEVDAAASQMSLSAIRNQGFVVSSQPAQSEKDA